MPVQPSYKPSTSHAALGGIVLSLDMHTAAKREFLTTFRDRILAPRDLEPREAMR